MTTTPEARKPRILPVKTCANKTVLHTGPIHGKGLCSTCFSYLTRVGEQRPSYLIEAALWREARAERKANKLAQAAKAAQR